MSKSPSSHVRMSRYANVDAASLNRNKVSTAAGHQLAIPQLSSQASYRTPKTYSIWCLIGQDPVLAACDKQQPLTFVQQLEPGRVSMVGRSLSVCMQETPPLQMQMRLLFCIVTSFPVQVKRDLIGYPAHRPFSCVTDASGLGIDYRGVEGGEGNSTK
jgi:hypothetical protein